VIYRCHADYLRTASDIATARLKGSQHLKPSFFLGAESLEVKNDCYHKLLLRASEIQVDVETLKTLVIFCGVCLVAVLCIIRFGFERRILLNAASSSVRLAGRSRFREAGSLGHETISVGWCK
jgi:hypothetical protein